MDAPELYRRIASVTATRFEFIHPVEPEDLETVRQALVDVLPPDHTPTVQTAGDFVLVEVRDPDGVCRYGRNMIVRRL